MTTHKGDKWSDQSQRTLDDHFEWGITSGGGNCALVIGGGVSEGRLSMVVGSAVMTVVAESIRLSHMTQ